MTTSQPIQTVRSGRRPVVADPIAGVARESVWRERQLGAPSCSRTAPPRSKNGGTDRGEAL